MLYDGRTTALQPRANAVHSAIAQQFVNCVERYRSSSSMQMYNRKHSRRFADSVGLGDGRNQCLRAGNAFLFGNRRRDRPVVATQTIIQSCRAVSRMQLLSGTSCAYGCTHRIRPHMTDGEPGSGWPNMDLSWAIFLPNQTRCYRNFAGVKTCGSLVRTDLCPPPLLLQTSRSWSR